MRFPNFQRRRAWLAAAGAIFLGLLTPLTATSGQAFAQGSNAGISPTQGPPGTAVVATGKQWTPGDEIQAIWGSATGPYVGSPVTVGSGGGFTLRFNVPSSAKRGSYQVFFFDETEQYFEVANKNFTVTRSSRPAAPSQVKVTPAGPLHFRITWKINSSDQAGFQLTNGPKTRTAGASQDSYQWAVSKPGTHMCFAVRAYNSAGHSGWAGQWTCATTPRKSSAPAAPSQVKVTPAGPLQFRITWKINSSDQAGFQLTNGVNTKAVAPGQDSYQWAVSKPGTYMCFAVRAYNSAGHSGWAGMWTCATTPAAGRPAAPTKVVATPYSTSAIEISFVNQAGNETGFRFDNGVVIDTANFTVAKGQATAVLWTGLAPGTYMCFKVAAYNQSGTSAYVPASWTCASSKTDWADSSFCSSYSSRYTGETWNGVAACGDAFGPNSNEQGEISFNGVEFDSVGFQCVELAARYFYYVTNQIPPTPAAGSGFAAAVAAGYGYGVSPASGGAGAFASSIKAGNIISMWGPADAVGHVGVITSVNVINGNGTITIMDENGSGSGTDTIAVNNGTMSYQYASNASYTSFQWTTNLPAPTSGNTQIAQVRAGSTSVRADQAGLAGRR